MREGLPRCGLREPAEEVGHQHVRETSAALSVDCTADVSARQQPATAAATAVAAAAATAARSFQRLREELAEACLAHSVDSTAVGAARHEFHGSHQPTGEEADTEELSHQRMQAAAAAATFSAAGEAATAAAAAATAVCSFQRMREELAEALAAVATLAQRDQPTQRCRHCERKTLSRSWNTNTSRAPGYARWCDGSCRTYFQSGKAWRCNSCELQYCDRCVTEGVAVKRP
jgi:hypothetical protein